ASRGLHRGLIDELPAFEGSAADSNPVGDRARALVVLQRHLADPRTRAAGGSNRRGFGTRHHPVGLAQVVAPTPSLRLADSRPPFGATENRRAPSGRSGGLPTGGLPAHRFRGLDAPRILRRALLLRRDPETPVGRTVQDPDMATLRAVRRALRLRLVGFCACGRLLGAAP